MIKAGIDIGNSKISLVVCDVKNNGSIKILSFISNTTNGIRKGLITNIDLLKEEINRCIGEAQKESETEIKSVILNLPSIESLSDYSETNFDISGEMVNDLHLKKAVNDSNILEIVPDYETILNLIVGYELDNQYLTESPLGTYGNDFKVKFYKFLIKNNYTKTYKSLFNQLNINVEDYVPTPLSSSLSTLNKDDKLLGAICIDLGASSSSICMFENSKVVFMDAINIGGQNITNDIARGIPTTIESAERLKTLYGSVLSSPSDENELIEVPYLSDDFSKSKQINLSTVNLIIKPRVEETLELIWQKLKDYNLHKKQIKNLVLTGGGSLLEGISEYAQQIFNSNVRIGKPLPLVGLEEKFFKPQFSQTLGTILFNKNDYEISFLKNKEKTKKNNVLSRFSTWLDQYI